MRSFGILMVVALTLPSATAEAKKAPARPTTQRFDALNACAAITDTAARLACYDREVAALKKAVADRQIVVLEQADLKRSQRELFGAAVPKIKLFDDLGSEDLDKLETAVTSVGRGSDGGLTFVTTEGALWEQSDDYPVSVKPGRKVTLKRGALGSFFAAFDKGVSIRVRRVR